MNIFEANRIIESFEKRKIIIERKDDGRLVRSSIKRILPMQSDEGSLLDVEILVNRKKNHFFSLKCFKEGRSWIRSIKVLSECDTRLKRGQRFKTKFFRDTRFARIKVAKMLNDCMEIEV